MTLLNSPNKMHILSGESKATLNIDKSILWHNRKTSLKWGIKWKLQNNNNNNTNDNNNNNK